MSHEVRVVSEPAVAAGFALAGLRPVAADTPEEGAACVRDLLGHPEIGVVLVESSFYDRLPEEVRRQLGRRPLPMVVPFPGPAWGARVESAEAYIVELLRQVIGYRVRLR
ncbi:MAG TPA: V-type ATP synthase subunit F [Gemmatimonadales bacterium]|nr:V-type ATP synthase subunit F [Gemmatimonadales bacterium]